MMRNRILVLAIILAMGIFAAAQQPDSSGSTAGSGDQTTTSPSGSGSQGTSQSDAGQSMPQTGSGDSAMSPSGSATDSQTSPGPQNTAPGQSSSQGAAGGNTIEGCLGGSAPNFTLISTDGTTYRLEIPANADTAPLTAHLGEPVQVTGTVNQAGNAGSPSIQVSTMGTGGSGKCSKPAPNAR